MEPRWIRISAFVLAAIILFGSLSIWAVSTQDTATADVGNVYDIGLNANDNLENILSNVTDYTGGINGNKTLFNITMHKDFPETSLNGTINLYNSNEINNHLETLSLELKADGEKIGYITLPTGYIRFDVSRGIDETTINITTTGEGSYTMKKEGKFDLGFLIEMNEKQETVRSQELLDIKGVDLAINSTVGGSVVEPGEGNFTYQKGDVVNLEAVPNTGYHFVKWTGDNGTIDDPTSNKTTIDMLDNYSISAEFAPKTYTLNISSTSGGNVTRPGEGTFTYNHGTTVDIEAVADANTSFVEWTGDNGTVNNTTSNRTTVEMLGNYSLTAKFDVGTYNLTINSSTGGSVVTPGESTFTYSDGEIVDLEAVADPNYRFDRWAGDNGTIADTTANQTTIEMLNDYNITAEFIPKTYNLTINSTEGGSATQPGEGTFTYQYGDIISLEAVANSGYRFDEWTGENSTIANTTSNQTSIEILDNYNITAEFSRPGLLRNSEFINGTDHWNSSEQGTGSSGWDSTENYENGGSVHVSGTQVGAGTTTHSANWTQEVEPTSGDITMNGAFRINLYAERQGNNIASARANASVWVYDTGTGGWEQIYFEERNIDGTNSLDTGWNMFSPEVTYTPTGEVTKVKAEMNVEVTGATHNQGPQTATADAWMDNITAVPVANQINSLNDGLSSDNTIDKSLTTAEKDIDLQKAIAANLINYGESVMSHIDDMEFITDQRRNK